MVVDTKMHPFNTDLIRQRICSDNYGSKSCISDNMMINILIIDKLNYSTHPLIENQFNYIMKWQEITAESCLRNVKFYKVKKTLGNILLTNANFQEHFLIAICSLNKINFSLKL